jgi:hypothetical protein
MRPLPRRSIWVVVGATTFFLACVACALFGAWPYIRI